MQENKKLACKIIDEFLKNKFSKENELSIIINLKFIANALDTDLKKFRFQEMIDLSCINSFNFFYSNNSYSRDYLYFQLRRNNTVDARWYPLHETAIAYLKPINYEEYSISNSLVFLKIFDIYNSEEEVPIEQISDVLRSLNVINIKNCKEDLDEYQKLKEQPTIWT